MSSVQWKEELSNLQWVPYRAREFSFTGGFRALTPYDLEKKNLNLNSIN